LQPAASAGRVNPKQKTGRLRRRLPIDGQVDTFISGAAKVTRSPHTRLHGMAHEPGSSDGASRVDELGIQSSVDDDGLGCPRCGTDRSREDFFTLGLTANAYIASHLGSHSGRSAASSDTREVAMLRTV
jgi:hypothetical protein